MRAITIVVLLLTPLGVLSTASEIQEAAKVSTPDGVSACDAIPVAEAHYCFGTAVANDGTVLFTEFNRREIKRWNPILGTTEVWRAKQTPGLFGLCANKTDDVFVGIDLGDTGDPGKVLRIGVDGIEAQIIQGITRPRQLACDLAGNLFVALEGGKILKCDHETGKSSEIMSAQPPVNGIAVGADGSLYVSEYAAFEQTPEGCCSPKSPGVVKVRRPDGTISVLASGFWRARGLALSGSQLFLCTEADREDHGNSGLLVRINTLTGQQETLLDKLDYPQFPSADAEGRIYFTLGRDNRLMRYDPASPFQVASIPDPDVQKATVRGGRIVWASSDEETCFSIQCKSRMLQVFLNLDDNSASIDGYVDLPANRFDVNPRALYNTFDSEHPTPGIFELPSVQAKCASGTITVEVLPLRCHQGQRWPMRNIGTPIESPAPGFSEQPEAFRFYFHWNPSEKKQP